MRHYPLLSLIPRGPARPLQPCHGVGAPQYKRPRFRAQKMPSCGAFGQPSLSSWFNKLSTANIQINFNTVYAPAHFFSKKTAFPYKSVALAPVGLRHQPAGRPRQIKLHISFHSAKQNPHKYSHLHVKKKGGARRHSLFMIVCPHVGIQPTCLWQPGPPGGLPSRTQPVNLLQYPN